MDKERTEVHRKICNKGIAMWNRGATNEEIFNFFVEQAFKKNLTTYELICCSCICGIRMGESAVEETVKEILGKEALKKILDVNAIGDCKDCKEAIGNTEKE